MSLLSKKAVVLLLAAVAGLGAINAQAAKAKDKGPSASVSMLGGKFVFTLPQGFTGDPIPPGPTGANGNMYINKSTKTVVIAAENDLPGQPGLKDNDDAFLDDTADSFIKEQRKGMSDFNKLAEKSLTLKRSGLGVRQVDSTVTQGGGLTLSTTLMAGSGNRMAIVQIISRPTDTKGHEELVNRIISGK